MIDSIALLLIIFIPALSGLFLLLKSNISYSDRRNINIFSSLAVLIVSIYSIFLFCSKLQDGALDGCVYSDSWLFGFIRHAAVIGQDNFMIVAALAIVSFCLSLFPAQPKDSDSLALSLFFKSSVFCAALSSNMIFASVMGIAAFVCYYFIFRQRIRLAGLISLFVSLAAFTILSAVGDSGGIKAFILSVFAVLLSGIPFADGWLSDAAPSSGDEIFAVVAAGKLGIILLIKFFGICSIEAVSFQVFLIAFAAILFILRTAVSFSMHGLFRIFVNYGSAISYVIIINHMAGSEASRALSQVLVFASLIISSSLLFCAVSLSNKTGTDSACRIRRSSSMASLLCFSCLSAVFIPGTVGFLPYLMMISSAFRNSLPISAVLFLSVPFISEACFLRAVSPMIFDRPEDTSRFPSFDRDELIGLVLLCFISVSVGIFPALFLSPSDLLAFFAK